MKKKVISLTSLALTLILILLLVSCGNSEDPWKKATYLEDAEFGEGSITVQVEVKAEDKSVTFTIKTDKKTLGDALLEHDLIAGEEGAYGLYVKVVNGITADFDVDQSYWGLSQNGENLMTGVDGVEIADGEHYELVYTK